MSDETSFDEASAIAIVGMAGRFPQAADVETFWANIRDGKECLTTYSEAELEDAGEDPALVRQPNYVKAGGPLEGMEEFDAGFFGFSPRDASIMDPQHRHILECAWEAFEDAAIDPDAFDGAIGVFAGSGHNAYMPYNLLTNPSLVDSVGFFLLRHTGNDKDFLATRISYCLKLTGPSLNIQTACSTSLVATHMACQSLLNSECDLALAGGVTIELPHRRGYLYEEGEILSPDGHCRAFDASSKGTLFGSAVGVVALRRYSDAVDAGDIIHAVIRGSAINNDGANKVGYLAPSVEGQAACIGEALALSDTDPATVTYVECHGTGTPVGDPIEVAALTQAFREETDETGFCGIGSVKTNIGHTDTAAGVASLIKVVKALENKQLPPSLHFDKPNPSIDFESSPFFVNHKLQPWKTDGKPRRAGINSLGVGGTNAFVVVEEAPPREPSGPSRDRQLLTLSARSAAAVERAADRLGAYLQQHPEVPLADVAYTLGLGRREFPHRATLVARDSADAARALVEREPGRLVTGRAVDDSSVAFLFPGGGAQYPNMGRELYDTEPVYKREVDECLTLLGKMVDWDLRPLLFPDPKDQAAVDKAAEELQSGSRTLTSLFITEYSLARLLMAWGIEPSALLGHSMGEYVAACLAGVFSVEDGLRMVLKRGELFEQVEAGSMISVPLSETDLRAIMAARGDDLDIAVINTPDMAVASGPVAAIDGLYEHLQGKDIDARRIKINVAAHSRMLEPILPEFAALTKTIEFSAPTMPFLSNVTGTWITEQDATDPDYWVRHLRGTVQFSENLQELLSDAGRIVLEVAPGRTLSSLAKAHPAAGVNRPIFNTLRHPSEDVSDVDFLLGVVGKAWMAGAAVDWKSYFADEERQRVSLPTYPFEHQRYWIEPGRAQAAAASRSLRKKSDIADWFYQPSWKRQLLPSAPPVSVAAGTNGDSRPWLVFTDDTGVASELVARLRAAGQTVVEVAAGKRFDTRGEHGYALRPDFAADYDALWGALEKRGLLPRRILHLWTVAEPDSPSGLERYDAEQALGFYSVLFLAQAIGKAGAAEPIDIAVVSNRMQQVAGEPVHCPERATVLGPCKVMMQEIVGVTCRSIDIEVPEPGTWQMELLLDRLPYEVLVPGSDHVVAYRGHDRFVQGFEPVRLQEASASSSRLRDGGVYLVTGGLGGLGLVLARHLASAHKARLVLLGRTPLPPRDTWDAYVAEHGRDDKTSARIIEVRELESAGAEVLVLAADVGNLDQVQAAVAAARDRFGPINGVFHTAGVLDDGIIQLKEKARAAAVLEPKVRGTMVLDQALSGAAGKDLDFLVLYSSVSAFTGLTGQVDYAAANAFLDAFAHARTERDGTLCVALNWNAWQHVGMAAELARELGVGVRGAAERPAAHPLLDSCVRETSRYREYRTTLSTETHWVVDEHRIKGGAAIVPGTGYVELLRAALAESAIEGKVVQVEELMFLAPFVVPDGEKRELRVVLERDGANECWEGQVVDRDGTVHATATLAFVDPVAQAGPPAKADLAALRTRCNERELTYDSAADEHLDFGPRWNNRQVVRFGDGEALVELALPDEFAADSPAFGLHPALMDFATAGAQSLIPGFDVSTHFYVPLSYGCLRAFEPLPAKVYSHVRLRAGAGTGDVATYDVTIYDDAGTPLCDIEEFVMRRVEDRAMMGEVASAATAGSFEARPDRAEAASKRSGAAIGNPILELGLEQGIAPDEGMEAVERVLAGPLTAQLVVSSQDLDALIESTRPAEPWESGEDGDDDSGTVKVPRPNLATPYVEPAAGLQASVAKVWEDILGVEGIGVDDDFFDLGGHSLLLTQVLSRVRKQVNTDISLRALFEKRTVAGIAEQIEAAAGDDASAGPVLERRERRSYTDSDGVLAFPASFMQQRLWFLDQLESGRAVYNIPQAFELRGKLDVEALAASIQEVVARHEALRTRFETRDGAPVQVVTDDRVELDVVDLENVPEADRRAEAERRANEMAQAAFDLTRAPLMAATLMRLGAEDHVLVLNVHHIVCDGWSLALLFGELSAIYAARVAGKPSPLAPQHVQYGDFAAWQQEYFADAGAAEDDLAFWKEYLGGELPQLALPFDRNRPPTASLRGKLARFDVSAEVTDAVNALAREEKTSLFMTLMAAFQAFLWRVSGNTDITVGSPIANRDRDEVQEGIGFYTNTVVYRGDLSGAPTFRELLRKTRETSLQVLAHQEVPLERVVEAVNPDRRSGDNPLFQVMFAVQKAPESALSLPGIELSGVDVHSATAKFDLLLEMQELSSGMQCFFEYATDLFDEDTADRLVGHFTHLLEKLVSDPDRSIAEAPILTDDQRRQILEEWNDTTVEFPRDARLHDRVAAAAAANPQAIAVQAGEQTLSYADLDARSSKLAHHLQSLGVGPDSMVGVYTERGVDMVVALVAALKAGAAYLPLDPSFPEDRIAYMIADSRAPVILTQAELVDDLPEHEARVFRLDADWDSVADKPTEAPTSDATSADNLAYMIYTSGSTGKPKGVQIPHRAVVNFLHSMAKTPGFGAGDKLLAVTTLSFDISVLELFLPLTTGGTVVVATRDQAVDGTELMELIDATGATVMQATPATWRLLIEAGWEGSKSLGKALCGGEAWPAGLARELIARVDEVWNMYGPTETTIWSTCARITDPDDVTIGTPIDNTQVYVLDKSLAPVPVGVAGELHIGGDGLARGYHNRPELTAEKFIANPLPGARDGARLYKTGDLVKFRADGTLQYLDRIDNQVKVRGYRIELGEIEAVLEKHPAVVQPVVIVWDSGNGDKRLAAYVVYESGKAPTGSELRAYLRDSLPDYMIPHLFVEMDALPLTANGKVNRRALPDPLKHGQADEREFVEPRTENERTVAELWKSTLGIDKVGVYDNFFDLGGHSLLSAQVTFKIEKATGYRLSPRAMVFQNLGQIAAELPEQAESVPKARSDSGAATPGTAPAPATSAAARHPRGQAQPSPSSLPEAVKPAQKLARKLFDKLRDRLR